MFFKSVIVIRYYIRLINDTIAIQGGVFGPTDIFDRIVSNRVKNIYMKMSKMNHQWQMMNLNRFLY